MGPMGKEIVHVGGNFSAENGVSLYKAAQAKLGIAILPSFILEAMSGKDMVILLDTYGWDELGIYAVYPSTRKPPLNTRVFIDFLLKNLS